MVYLTWSSSARLWTDGGDIVGPVWDREDDDTFSDELEDAATSRLAYEVLLTPKTKINSFSMKYNAIHVYILYKTIIMPKKFKISHKSVILILFIHSYHIFNHIKHI